MPRTENACCRACTALSTYLPAYLVGIYKLPIFKNCRSWIKHYLKIKQISSRTNMSVLGLTHKQTMAIKYQPWLSNRRQSWLLQSTNSSITCNSGILIIILTVARWTISWVNCGPRLPFRARSAIKIMDPFRAAIEAVKVY